MPEADLAIKPADEAPVPLADLALREPVRAVARKPMSLGLIHPARDNEVGAPASASSRSAAAIAERPGDTPPAADLALFQTETPAVSAPPREIAPARESILPREPAPEAPAVRVGETAARVAGPAARQGEPALPNAPGRVPARSAHTTELPLFVKAMPQEGPVARPAESDEPLVKVPTAPRPPLSVRRAQPEPPKNQASAPTSTRKLGPLDRDLLDDLRRVEKEEERQARAEARQAAMAAGEPLDDVGIGRRLMAAAIDVVFVGAVVGTIFWATFRVIGVSPADVGPAAHVPLAAFLLLIVFGYLAMFTVAGGQTLGKMAMGIRVVGSTPDHREEPLTPGQAIYREVLALPLLLPLGAGLLPALVGRGDAVYDRLAHTRVVRV
jgi:uncharacterized RDD family membrane protein YckC